MRTADLTRVFTSVDALGERIGEAIGLRNAELERVLDAHGLDPRDWPAEALDRIVELDGHAIALKSLAERAKRRDIDWTNRNLEPRTKP